jgi:hypothetical protein
MNMNIADSRPRSRMWLMVMALAALAAGCGRDPILGTNGIAALVPAVTAETPADGATAHGYGKYDGDVCGPLR